MKKTIIISSIITVLALNFYAQISYAQTSFAQEIDKNLLRRIVLHSDVILAGSYGFTTQHINDYATEEYFTVTKVDSIVVNASGFALSYTMKVPQQLNDYPSLLNRAYICGKPVPIGIGIDNKRYSNIIFLKKNNKQYELVSGVDALEWNDITDNYFPAIQKIKEIEKIKDYNLRYSKTIDWYIENNDFPDDYFTEFYKQKKIMMDTLVLTDRQLQKAKEKFLQGNEKLLPFLGNQFSKEINEYLLEKLEKIRSISRGEATYSDYYDFEKIISNKYDFNFGSIEYLLLDELLSDHRDYYDKKIIMNYFIKMVECENKKE